MNRNLEGANTTVDAGLRVTGCLGEQVRGSTDSFMAEVPKRDAETLIPVRQKYIRLGTIIYSECCLAGTYLTYTTLRLFCSEESDEVRSKLEQKQTTEKSRLLLCCTLKKV